MYKLVPFSEIKENSKELIPEIAEGNVGLEYLLDTEWNGETYIVLDSGKEYRPVYKKIDEDNFEIIGYEEV